MTLEQILGDLFFRNEEPLRLLRKHGLDLVLSNSIQLIKLEIDKPKIDFTKFGLLASNILISVNSKLKNITDPIEKGYLELILKDVTEYLINKVVQKSYKPERLIQEISHSLKIASSINNYSYEALIRLLKIENPNIGFNPQSNNVNGTFHYEWKGYPHDLDELVDALKYEGWIPSVKEFKKLFKNHEGNLKIQFARDKINELLALFDELKARKLIKPKGGRGHFHALSIYLVDLENSILFERPPKIVKMIAKRNNNYWQNIIKTAKELVVTYKVKAP
ncbi:MAG TPA: hypothetical protein PK185_16165 [Cyclobacteriaceae bacterium]|nr:hypothetical protein [Cyclobacteriaceae bacterium]